MNLKSESFNQFKNKFIETRVNQIYPKDLQVIYPDRIRGYKGAVEDGVRLVEKWIEEYDKEIFNPYSHENYK